MPSWRVFSNVDAAEAAVRQMEASLAGPGAERTAAKAADVMMKAAHGAFASESDPRTGEHWAPPSPASHIVGRLLHRTGALEGALRSGYALTPGGARAFLNVDASEMKIAMIQLYGGRGKSKSAKARARRSKAMGRSNGWSLPARRFIGVSQEEFNAMRQYAEQNLLGKTDV